MGHLPSRSPWPDHPDRLLQRVVTWLVHDQVRVCVRPSSVTPCTRGRVDRHPPDQGIWTFAYRAINHRGDEVMTFRSSFMILRRPDPAR